MADLNAQLEAFLSNALAERSVQSREVRKHMPGLKQLLLRIRQAIADSGVMEPSPSREPRVRLLVSTIAEVIQREWGVPTLAAMQADLVPYFAKQLAFGRRMIETAGGTLANAGAVVAAPARVAAAVDGAVVQGKLFGQTITRSIPGLIADRVERYIRLGLGDVASGDVLYRDAVVSYAQRTVEATIRTAVHETGNAAQQLIYQVEADPAWLGEDGLVWTSSLDSTVCPTCIALNGKRYPTGSVKVSPHPNCLMPDTIVDAGNITAATRATYSGILVTIKTRSGRILTLTGNHPVLTTQGWKAAKLINEGDQTINHCVPVGGAAINPDLNQGVTTAEQLFALFAHQGNVSRSRMPAIAVDFHGDGAGLNLEIDILSVDRPLADCGHPAILQPLSDQELVPAGVLPVPVASFGPLDQLLLAAHLASAGIVRSLDLLCPLVAGHLTPLEGLCFASIAARHPAFSEPLGDGASVDAQALRDLVLAHPGLVELDDVTGVERNVTSHQVVYDFTTASGCYFANHILAHNCNCYLLPWKYEKQDGANRKATGDKGAEYIPVKRTTESFLRDNPDTTRQIFGKARGEALLRDLRSNDEKTRRNALNRAVKSWQAT